VPINTIVVGVVLLLH